jgi:hypothetical protein
MYPVSDRFLEAVVSSHTRTSKAVLLNNGLPVMELPITDGSVTVDRNANVRRTCKVRIEGREDLIPQHGSDVLFPRVNEMQLWSGVSWDENDEEIVPLGVFRIVGPDMTLEDFTSVIQLDGVDRSDRAEGNRITKPWVVPSKKAYWSEIRRFIAAVDPRARFNFNNVGYLTPQIIFDIGTKPWSDGAMKMAASVGHELAYDVMGVCCLQEEPDPSSDPIVTVWIEGEGNAVTDLQRVLDSQYGYNHVAIRSFTSTGQEGPVVAEAFDNNPLSPTYVGNPPGSSDYGLVTYFASSGFLNTLAQCQVYANSTLQRVLGAGEIVSGKIIPNPALDVGDIVSAQYSPMKVYGDFVLDTLEIPLGEGDMSFVAQRRQVR